MSSCPTLLFSIVVYFFFFFFSALPLPIAAQCSLATIYGLKTADCINLDLTSIPRTIDADLKTLNFHGNRLTYLDVDTFSACPSLQNLYLVRNSLESIAADAFRQLQNLQILDLEGNRLLSIPGNSFRFTPSLRFLSLRSNPISYVTNSDLTFLKNVEVLNLENCWLKRIEPRAFGHLHRLYELNLVNNELHGLSAEMADTISPTLTVLRVHSNPWQCDCRLRWLRVLVVGVPNWDFGQNTPTCAGPELLRGVAWKQLVPDQFACPSTIVVGNATTIRELGVGANASIECVASGDPQPTVTWMKGSRFVPDDLVSQSTIGVGGGRDAKLVRSVVTLRDVSEADANDYKCIAVNTAGRSEVTYKVLVSRVINRGGAGGSGKDATVAATGAVLSPELMLVAAVMGTGLVCAVLMCVTCAVMRGRANRRSERERLASRLKTVPVDDVGPPSPAEDSFRSSRSPSSSSGDSECPSSTCGVRDRATVDETAGGVGQDNNPTEATWVPRTNASSVKGRCRVSPAGDDTPLKPTTIPRRRISSLVEPDQAFEVDPCVSRIVPLEPEPDRDVHPAAKEAPDDAVTPDLLSDRHVINYRIDRVVETTPSRMTDSSSVCVGSRQRASEGNDGSVREDDQCVMVDNSNAKPLKGIERQSDAQHHDINRRQRAGSVEVKSFCDNPVCLRERLSDAPSQGGAPAAPGRIVGGAAGNGGVVGERLFPVMGSICSHRLALRKDITKSSSVHPSLVPGRTAARPPRSSHRNPRRNVGVPPFNFDRPITGESFRDRHSRPNGAIIHNHQPHTISRNPEASRVWASQQNCLDSGRPGTTTRNGRIPHGGHSSGRTPGFCMRASSGGLDRAEDRDFDDDPFPVTLNKRQTFSSMSLNEILSPPFGFRAYRQSGTFDGQRTRTGSRREMEDLRGTAV